MPLCVAPYSKRVYIACGSQLPKSLFSYFSFHVAKTLRLFVFAFKHCMSLIPCQILCVHFFTLQEVLQNLSLAVFIFQNSYILQNPPFALIRLRTACALLRSYFAAVTLNLDGSSRESLNFYWFYTDVLTNMTQYCFC